MKDCLLRLHPQEMSRRLLESNQVQRRRLSAYQEAETKHRSVILSEYALIHNLAITPGIQLCKEGIDTTVVIPAFNEETTIAKAITSLLTTSQDVEVCIVDNGSSDKTREIVENLQKIYDSRLSYIYADDYKGPGYARKRGMDEAIMHYLSNNPSADTPHYLVMFDADTIAHPQWLKEAKRKMKQTGVSAVTSLYIYPEEVDTVIEKTIGIKEYFGSINKVATFLLSNEYIQPRVIGASTLVEIAAYASVGGVKHNFVPFNAEHVEAAKIKGEDYTFGQELLQHGHTISFIPISNATDPRRTLQMLSHLPEHSLWIDVREDYRHLLTHALTNISVDEWKRQQRKLQYYFVFNYIIHPVLDNQLSLSPLKKLVGPDHSFFAFLEDAINTSTPQEKLKRTQEIDTTVIENLFGNLLCIIDQGNCAQAA